MSVCIDVKFEDKVFFLELSRDTEGKMYIAMTETVDSVEARGDFAPETYDLIETDL